MIIEKCRCNSLTLAFPLSERVKQSGGKRDREREGWQDGGGERRGLVSSCSPTINDPVVYG